MNRLNRKIEYSLIALKHMSRKVPGELTSAKEIAERYQSPFDATARVMQLMAQNGILKSEQGAQGGYLIMKDLSKVTMQDLINIVQGPTSVAKCLSEKEACELQSHCNIVSPMSVLNQKISDFYKNLTLKELLVRERQP
jgi:Rrf2 family nitric oxide-sensitive transcriptional repressor